MHPCPYCGESSGLFHTHHEECKKQHDAGVAAMVAAATKAAETGEGIDDLPAALKKIAGDSLVKDGEVHGSLVSGWEGALHAALADKATTVDEESHLAMYAQKLGLSREELNRNGGWNRLAMASTLRQILEGKVPPVPSLDSTLPFNFLKTESLVWAFPNVRYFEDRTQRQYVGGYQGASIRVMKGVYYHTGGSRGHAVESTSRVEADHGLFAITTKNLYFEGNTKRFRIPYVKVVSFEPYSDGIGVQRDAASAKPQTFVTGEGWFVYNAVVNLATM
jgi:hypothetical protein